MSRNIVALQFLKVKRPPRSEEDLSNLEKEISKVIYINVDEICSVEINEDIWVGPRTHGVSCGVRKHGVVVHIKYIHGNDHQFSRPSFREAEVLMDEILNSSALHRKTVKITRDQF